MPADVTRRTLIAAGSVIAAASATSARAVLARPSTGTIRYEASKGSCRLALYRRRAAASAGPNGRAPVIILVHGSTIAALASFDLHVASGAQYSMMDVLSRAGFDVWTLDFDGYGASGSSGGNSDVASGVADLRAAVAVIARETGQQSYHLYGQSSGALRVGAFAMAEPDRVRHVVLESFTWTGEGAPTLIARRKNIASYRADNWRKRDADSIAATFTRDHSEATDREAIDAVLAVELRYRDRVPSGTYIDMSANLPLVDPTRLKMPVMLLRGEYDGIATEDDLLRFYAKLPNPTRQFINIGGAAHGILLGVARRAAYRALIAFLPAPETAPP